jgi:RHS repeat-associated protein
MRTRHKKNHSAKRKALLFKKIKWWGIAFISLIVLFGVFFSGGSITAKAANLLASFKIPARSAADTSPYPYFEPDTQVQVYSGIGGNGWESVPYRQIRREQEYLYEGKFYDIDPNGWVRFNESVTATESTLTEADRVFEPYNSRLPEPEDLVRFVDSQNNHLRHNRAGACQANDYFWFQGALYYCAANPENPAEYVVTSTYHVLNAEGKVIPVEEFALARGDSLEDVYGTSVSYPVSYSDNSQVASPALDSGSGFPTDYGFTGHRLDSATGLIYMNSRYYDPQLGRFISPDTIIPERYDSAAFDRYAYARNNPVLYVDPSGHCWGIASGIRGLPTYDVTCNNLDMALSIAQNPNATGGQKAGAVAYIAAEGIAHTALVVGTGVLAWEGGVALLGSEAATTAGAAACADGDCTNETIAIKTAVENGAKAIQNGVGQGYSSFDAFKYSQGAAGNGMAWHHIVEQTPANIQQFGIQTIQNTNNLIRVPNGAGLLHQQISGYYSSIQPLVTGSQSLTIRQWIQTQSFEFQWKFGMGVIQRFGGAQYIIDRFGGPR